MSIARYATIEWPWCIGCKIRFNNYVSVYTLYIVQINLHLLFEYWRLVNRIRLVWMHAVYGHTHTQTRVYTTVESCILIANIACAVRATFVFEWSQFECRKIRECGACDNIIIVRYHWPTAELWRAEFICSSLSVQHFPGFSNYK